MSEPKRVAFSTSTLSSSTTGAGASTYRTVGASSSLAANKTTSRLFGNSNESEMTTDADSDDKTIRKTFRLELPLFQSDSNSYPEFNYARLVQLERKKMKKMKSRTNGFPDNMGENTNADDVARIAREFEKKYGTSYVSGRSRNKNGNSHDKGRGYDENDSFIDNTEAYDEILPEEVETLEGGFYINCGALEFKKLQTELTTTKTDEIIKMPSRPKTRVLSSSSSSASSSDESSSCDEDEDDGNEAIDVDGDDDEEEEADEDEAEDSSTTANNNNMNKGQKNGNSSSSTIASVATTTTKKSKSSKSKNYTDGRGGGQKTAVALSCSSSTTNSPKPLGEEFNSDSDKERAAVAAAVAAGAASVKTTVTTVKDMLKAKRDTYLKAQVNDKKITLNGQEKSAVSSCKSSNGDDNSSSSEDDSSDSSDSAMQYQKPNAELQATTNQPIPVSEEKVEIKLPCGLNKSLLDKLQEFKEYALSKDMMNQKFKFDDLLIKSFLEIDEILLTMDKSQRSLVLAHLEFHLQQPKYFFLRKSKQLRTKEEKIKNNRALGKLSKAVIEIMPSAIANYEVELRKCAELHALSAGDQPPVMPKKEFSWNKNFRNLLYEVYEVRLKSYGLLRTRKESIDDFIANYLRGKVCDVWPNGWMQLEDLQREIDKSKISRDNKLNRESKKNKNNNNHNNNIPALLTADLTISSSASGLTASTSTTTQGMNYQVSRENANNFIGNPFSVPQLQQSSSNKRKNSDAGGVAKSRKTKAQKKDHANEIANLKAPLQNNNNNNMNGGQQQAYAFNLHNTNAAPTSLSSTSAATTFNNYPHQHSIQMTSTLTTATTTTTNTKKPAHIIDLDNYRSAQDILKESKQLLNAGQPAQSTASLATTNTITTTAVAVPQKGANQHDSSSESDGVEIVGYCPPPSTLSHNNNNNTNNNNNNNNNKYIKYKNKNMDFQNAFTSQYGTASTVTPSANHNNHSNNYNHNNNNNNHNSGNNSSSSSSSNKSKQNNNKNDLDSKNNTKNLLSKVTSALSSLGNSTSSRSSSPGNNHKNQNQQ